TSRKRAQVSVTALIQTLTHSSQVSSSVVEQTKSTVHHNLSLSFSHHHRQARNICKQRKEMTMNPLRLVWYFYRLLFNIIYWTLLVCLFLPLYTVVYLFYGIFRLFFPKDEGERTIRNLRANVLERGAGLFGAYIFRLHMGKASRKFHGLASKEQYYEYVLRHILEDKQEMDGTMARDAETHEKKWTERRNITVVNNKSRKLRLNEDEFLEQIPQSEIAQNVNGTTRTQSTGDNNQRMNIGNDDDIDEAVVVPIDQSATTASVVSASYQSTHQLAVTIIDGNEAGPQVDSRQQSQQQQLQQQPQQPAETTTVEQAMDGNDNNNNDNNQSRVSGEVRYRAKPMTTTSDICEHQSVAIALALFGEEYAHFFSELTRIGDWISDDGLRMSVTTVDDTRAYLQEIMHEFNACDYCDELYDAAGKLDEKVYTDVMRRAMQISRTGNTILRVFTVEKTLFVSAWNKNTDIFGIAIPILKNSSDAWKYLVDDEDDNEVEEQTGHDVKIEVEKVNDNNSIGLFTL
ncbi:hypothetical protein GQ42DRAFT_169124, partial [Ramicandelaber brevisporus]